MKLLKIIIPLLVIALAVTLKGFPRTLINPSTVRSVGDLNVDWGVPDGNPIFVVNNIVPGDTESRTVHVTNSASTNRPVGVRGVKTSESGDLSTVLSMVISENGTDIYGGTSSTGPKTLAEFFDESGGPDGIPLSMLGPGNDTHYTFEVEFDENVGNEFQGKSVVFDLKIGIAIQIPDECQNIQFTGNPIFGTEKRDVLNGTEGNDLIVSFEGDDVINAKAGDDCLIGGAGNDIIHGQNGNDIVFGDEGDDRLWGDNGNDKIYGGSGNDRIEANNDDDFVNAGEGSDDVDGGNGSDTCLNAEKMTKCELLTTTSTSKKR